MSTSDIINLILIGVLVLVTLYYAMQTHRQANLLSKQVQMITEQRLKSITPVLQVKSLSYQFYISDIPNTHKKAYIPGLQMYVSNVGVGSALNIKITAAATVKVTRGSSPDGIWCHLIWGMTEVNQEVYLDSTTEPKKCNLQLYQVESSTHRKRDNKIQIQFKYKDIDRNLLTELKLIELGKDISSLRYDVNEPKSIPGDIDFPDNPIHSF